jgi:hypothetical protein
LLVRQVKFVNELLIGGCFFKRVKINAMKVLYDSLFQRESVIDIVLNQHGNDLKPREARGAPAAFTRDEFKEIALAFDRANNDRLQNAKLSN